MTCSPRSGEKFFSQKNDLTYLASKGWGSQACLRKVSRSHIVGRWLMDRRTPSLVGWPNGWSVVILKEQWKCAQARTRICNFHPRYHHEEGSSTHSTCPSSHQRPDGKIKSIRDNTLSRSLTRSSPVPGKYSPYLWKLTVITRSVV